MHVLQRGRHLGRDPQRVSQCDRVVRGIGDPVGNVAAAGVLGHEVRPAIAVFAAVIEGDRVGVPAYARDGIELAPHPQLADVVEGLGLAPQGMRRHRHRRATNRTVLRLS